jgi:cell division protein FtsN
METPPAGYEPPTSVYLVEQVNDAGEIVQIGGFLQRDEAEKLRVRLASEGIAAQINEVPIHRRWADYEFDR